MTEILTPGRWRGLKATSKANDIFTILAFDQRGSFRRMLPDGTSYEEAVQIKEDVVIPLSNYASAALLDSTYGLTPALKMSGQAGVLLALEKSGYSGDSTYRKMEFQDDWSVAKIKKFGAAAIKLLVYYNPESGELATEIEEMVSGIIAECRTHDIPVFLEPLSYSLEEGVSKESAEFAAIRPNLVKETARKLGALKPDVLKLEAPIDVHHNDNRDEWRTACEAVSEVSPVPWVILSAGVDFEIFEEQTKIACQAGASGFLAGRAIWKESATMTADERAAFIEGKATERIQKLIDVAMEYGRPWTDFYAPMEADESWINSYA